MRYISFAIAQEQAAVTQAVIKMYVCVSIFLFPLAESKGQQDK
jgi:hypothetical protein